MADSKKGGKNRKFGRHSRNPSSKMQAQRSARNKRKNIEAHPHSRPGHAHTTFADAAHNEKIAKAKAAGRKVPRKNLIAIRLENQRRAGVDSAQVRMMRRAGL